MTRGEGSPEHPGNLAFPHRAGPPPWQTLPPSSRSAEVRSKIPFLPSRREEALEASRTPTSTQRSHQPKRPLSQAASAQRHQGDPGCFRGRKEPEPTPELLSPPRLPQGSAKPSTAPASPLHRARAARAETPSEGLWEISFTGSRAEPDPNRLQSPRRASPKPGAPNELAESTKT